MKEIKKRRMRTKRVISRQGERRARVQQASWGVGSVLVRRLLPLTQRRQQVQQAQTRMEKGLGKVGLQRKLGEVKPAGGRELVAGVGVVGGGVDEEVKMANVPRRNLRPNQPRKLVRPLQHKGGGLVHPERQLSNIQRLLMVACLPRRKAMRM
jgi:hypothetical protein